VVVPEDTGLLVPVEQDQGGSSEVLNPPQYARDLAAAINRVMGDKPLRDRMAAAGRKRAEDHFSWHAIAERTHALYQSLL
jgi:starch synthase